MLKKLAQIFKYDDVPPGTRVRVRDGALKGEWATVTYLKSIHRCDNGNGLLWLHWDNDGRVVNGEPLQDGWFLKRRLLRLSKYFEGETYVELREE